MSHDNPKNYLQELCQRMHLPLPTYARSRAGGLDHMPTFETVVALPAFFGSRTFTGSGTTAKDADQNAARVALRDPAVASCLDPRRPPPATGMYVPLAERLAARGPLGGAAPASPLVRGARTGAGDENDGDDTHAERVNPDPAAAARVILVDLENQHGALAYQPQAGDYALGFVHRAGAAAVNVGAASYAVMSVDVDAPDAADAAIMWHVAQLVLSRGLPARTDVYIISADQLFLTLARVIARQGVRLHVMTYDVFALEEELRRRYSAPAS